MRKSRLISGSLAATLSAAAVAGPAFASSVPGPPRWAESPTPITAYASQLRGPPKWPTDPKPITEYRSTVQETDGGFDWRSAGIGAGAGIAVLAAGMAGLAGVRRRRHAGPQTLTSS